MDRRTFVYNATLGTLHLGLRRAPCCASSSRPRSSSLKIDLHAPDPAARRSAMPGLFPGRVVEVFHPGAIVDRRDVAAGGAHDARRRHAALTGESRAERMRGRASCRRPTSSRSRSIRPARPATVTSIALLREVIRALNAVGVPNTNIIVYDRNSNQLEVNGYHTLVPAGVRVVGLDQRWSVKGSRT